MVNVPGGTYTIGNGSQSVIVVPVAVVVVPVAVVPFVPVGVVPFVHVDVVLVEVEVVVAVSSLSEMMASQPANRTKRERLKTGFIMRFSGLRGVYTLGRDEGKPVS